MKSKGFTLIELMIVLAVFGILLAIAVPNLLKFQCRAFGGSLELNTELVEEVCNNCVRCGNEDVTKQKALQMIKDGTDPSRFIEWQSGESVDKPSGPAIQKSTTSGKIEFPDKKPSGMNTNDLPEPMKRSWKD